MVEEKIMKYNVTRDYTHFEYAVVEAESYEEAIQKAKMLDEDAWEEDLNAAIIESWNYEAEEVES